MKKTYQIFIVTAFVVVTSLTLYAHSGRTDSSGGHYNRKTGTYHYHSGGTSSPSPSSSELTQSKPDTSSVTPTPTTAPTLNKQEKSEKPIRITENHWQVALNNKLFNGKLEVIVSTGRVDIVTDTLVIEVDKVSKYQEGIEQALKYARATEKKPILALYIDGEKDGYELLQIADKLCKEKGVTLLLANSYVSVNDLIDLISEAGVGPTAESKTLPIVKTNNDSKLTSNTANNQDNELKYWITNSSGVRHNSSCRYYMNSNGRKCSKNEGRACKICGG